MMTIIGVVLILAGGFLFVRGGSFTTQRDVLDVGGITVSADEERPIAPWIAGLTIALGVGLVVAGVRTSKA